MALRGWNRNGVITKRPFRVRTESENFPDLVNLFSCGLIHSIPGDERLPCHRLEALMLFKQKKSYLKFVFHHVFIGRVDQYPLYIFENYMVLFGTYSALREFKCCSKKRRNLLTKFSILFLSIIHWNFKRLRIFASVSIHFPVFMIGICLHNCPW